MSYIGNEPIVSATRTVTEVTATAGQTSFTPNGGYTVGFLDVFINGSKLTNTDFTATNGTTVTLNEAAQAGDIVRLEALGTFLTSSAVPLTGGNITGNLNVSGNLGVGTTSPISGFKLDVQGGDFRVGDDANQGFEAGYSAGASQAFVQGYNRGTSAFIDMQISAATLKFGTGSSATERMRITSGGDLQFNSGYGSVATAYGCRAWVNFNGTGTVAIRASGNVSSITDNGTGLYRVNFTNAMPDANYSVVVSTEESGVIGMTSQNNLFQQTTSSAFVRCTLFNETNYDPEQFNVAIFR